MIVSHKHKFIFVKTHKTATQTFLKFIKPHLGPDDVMAGDPPNPNKNNPEGTKLNEELPFEATGKTALELQEVYGNHIPWFMIKETIGEDIWNDYTKITIERNPYDRILSLFFFLNSIFTRDNLKLSGVGRKNLDQAALLKAKDTSWVDHAPESVREFFEDWIIMQLRRDIDPDTSKVFPSLTEHKTYGAHANNIEVSSAKQIAEKLKLDNYIKLISGAPVETGPQRPDGGRNKFIYNPYTNESNYQVFQNPFSSGDNLMGHCRFLNFGYYWDGNDLQVDEVIDYSNIANNIGKAFAKHDIDIKCNKSLFDAATQNDSFRRSQKTKKPNEWWYAGKRSEWIHKLIKQRFYNDNMTDKQINFNKIISK